MLLHSRIAHRDIWCHLRSKVNGRCGGPVQHLSKLCEIFSKLKECIQTKDDSLVTDKHMIQSLQCKYKMSWDRDDDGDVYYKTLGTHPLPPSTTMISSFPAFSIFLAWLSDTLYLTLIRLLCSAWVGVDNVGLINYNRNCKILRHTHDIFAHFRS